MNDRYLLQYVSKQLKTIIRQYTLEGKITEKFTYCDQMKDEFGEMEIYNLFIKKSSSISSTFVKRISIDICVYTDKKL